MPAAEEGGVDDYDGEVEGEGGDLGGVSGGLEFWEGGRSSLSIGWCFVNSSIDSWFEERCMAWDEMAVLTSAAMIRASSMPKLLVIFHLVQMRKATVTVTMGMKMAAMAMRAVLCWTGST